MKQYKKYIYFIYIYLYFYFYFIYIYFIEYIAHFFILKMMLKYSLRTMHGRQLRKGLKMAFTRNKLAMNDSCEIIVEK